MFDDDIERPFLRVIGGSMATPACQKDPACNFILGMAFQTFIGEEPMVPGETYAGDITCHGLRDMTEEELAHARQLGQPATGQICHFVVRYGKDF